MLDQQVTTKREAKCLGVWWAQDLSSRQSIEDNISKSRRAFFALGAINVYTGACNPLVSLSLFCTFVLPVLLYGCESWYLTEPLLRRLDSFQAEVGKRILKLPRSFNNLSVLLGLRWSTFTVSILIKKLTFLTKLINRKTDCTSSRLFHTLLSKGKVYDISLVQQIMELESIYKTNYLDHILKSSSDSDSILKEAKIYLLEADWNKTLSTAKSHSSLAVIVDDNIVNEWIPLWDKALDYGLHGTRVAQTLFRLLCRPSCLPCPYCGVGAQSFIDHLVDTHGLGFDDVRTALISDKPSLFEKLNVTIKKFYQFT